MLSRLLALALVASPFLLAAQITTGSWIAGTTVHVNAYNQDAVDYLGNPPGTIQISTKRVNHIQVTPNIGYALNRHFLLGLGLGLVRDQANTNPDHEESTQTSGAQLLSFTEERTTALSPNASAEYLAPVSDRFCIGAVFTARYTLYNWKRYSYYRIRTTSSGNILEAINTAEAKYKTRGYELQISPSFRYNVGRHFGLQLLAGGIGLQQKLKDTSYADFKVQKPEWNIDFAPANWALGFYVNIGGVRE